MKLRLLPCVFLFRCVVASAQDTVPQTPGADSQQLTARETSSAPTEPPKRTARDLKSKVVDQQAAQGQPTKSKLFIGCFENKGVTCDLIHQIPVSIAEFAKKEFVRPKESGAIPVSTPLTPGAKKEIEMWDLDFSTYHPTLVLKQCGNQKIKENFNFLLTGAIHPPPNGEKIGKVSFVLFSSKSNKSSNGIPACDFNASDIVVDSLAHRIVGYLKVKNKEFKKFMNAE